MYDFRADHLSRSPRLLPFSRHELPHTAADLAALIPARQKAHLDRDALANALMAQYTAVPDAQHTLAQIETLRQPSTFTVTTGHQLCLWGGPLFFTYKVLTAIRLAEEMSRAYPRHHFVPVLWRASEDHDAEEINHYHKGFGEKVTYAARITGAVGRHRIAPSFFDTLPDWEAARSLYQVGEPYAKGFLRMVHHLFGKYGLVVVDGDSHALKAMWSHELLMELESGFSFAQVEATNQALAQAGYPIQAHARPLNLFHLSEGIRQRLEATPQGFRLVDTGREFTPEEIGMDMLDHPENFSPNVILRPLYQETILPNLAYIGGWGEFAYWMQLGGVFDAAERPFPALLPRFSAHLLPANAHSLLEAQRLTPQDLLLPLHELQDKVARSLWSHAPTEDALRKLQASYDDVIATLQGLDPTLARSFTGLQVENAHRGEHLMKKVRKSVRNRHPSAFQPLEQLRQQWFAQTPQERTLSLWCTGMPPEDFISLVHGQLNPFDPQTAWIQLP